MKKNLLLAKHWLQERKLFSVLFENSLFYFLCLVADHQFGDGTRWLSVFPHPFWIAILISSVKYGTLAGVLSAFLATIFLYVGNVPEMTFEDTLFDYRWHLVLRPLLFVGIAYILGELQTKERIEKNRIEKKNMEMEEHIRRLVQSYEMIKQTKEQQEAVLAAQQNTFVSIYDSFRSLETLKPAQIILNVDKVIKSILNPKKLSVWALGDKGFEPLTCVHWEESDAYIRRFSLEQPLSKALIEKQKALCVTDKEDALILEGEGLLAAPLVDNKTGELFGMVKIEEMEFLELTSTTIETFRILCDLIGKAYTNARRYKWASKNMMRAEGGFLGTHAYYLDLKRTFAALCESEEIPLSNLEIESSVHYPRTSLIHLQLLEKMKQAEREILPPGGKFFLGENEGKQWHALLPGVNAEEGERLSYSLLEAFDKGNSEGMDPLKIKVEETVKKKRERVKV